MQESWRVGGWKAVSGDRGSSNKGRHQWQWDMDNGRKGQSDGGIWMPLYTGNNMAASQSLHPLR